MSDVDLETVLEPFETVCNRTFTDKSKPTYEQIYHLSVKSETIEYLRRHYKLRPQKDQIASRYVVTQSVERYLQNLQVKFQDQMNEYGKAMDMFKELLEEALDQGSCTIYKAKSKDANNHIMITCEKECDDDTDAYILEFGVCESGSGASHVGIATGNDKEDESNTKVSVHSKARFVDSLRECEEVCDGSVVNTVKFIQANPKCGGKLKQSEGKYSDSKRDGAYYDFKGKSLPRVSNELLHYDLLSQKGTSKKSGHSVIYRLLKYQYGGTTVQKVLLLEVKAQSEFVEARKRRGKQRTERAAASGDAEEEWRMIKPILVDMADEK